ncbi:MAG TPA: hypothetical protein VHZ74_02420 [Bryobacteraceae bacterium]|nr:hypothetical protein [Bryobacteraceae bacterium]
MPRRLSALFLFAIAAQAQSPAQQNELIQQLLHRIDQLESRVTELEATRAPGARPAGIVSPATPAAPPASPVAAAVANGGHDHGTPIEAATTTYPSLKLSGFGDINYTASDRPGTHAGFNEGQFILHFSSALSSKVTYFGELSLTARTDAGAGTPPAAGFNPEVERSILRYDYNDHLKISFGRYHTPVSYWNTEFHHGSWLQTTASRPEMIQFGGSFIPVHFVGALAEGSFSAGGLNLNYNAGLGNGRSSVLSRSGDFGDINNNKAWLATVFIKPDKLYGLQLGGTIYRDKIDATGRPEAQEWIESAHIVWSKENPEFIAEFFNINHKLPGTGLVTNNQAWYAQVAYRLPMAERWKPYYRYEYIHTPRADAIFSGLNLGLSSSTLGVRFDFSSFAAFKLEYRNQARPGLANTNVAWAQTSFTF